MKLTVWYDPHTGHYTRDSEAQGWVDDIIHTAFHRSKLPDMDVIVGTELIVNCFRLRLAEGVIKPKWIEFKYGDEILVHNKYGRIEHWPKGFCDYTDNILTKLLELGMKAYKERKGVTQFPNKKK